MLELIVLGIYSGHQHQALIVTNLKQLTVAHPGAVGRWRGLSRQRRSPRLGFDGVLRGIIVEGLRRGSLVGGERDSRLLLQIERLLGPGRRECRASYFEADGVAHGVKLRPLIEEN